ncbi:MAG: TraV family lipoprotein [Burkholderiales bacterium]|nr:TraV family lipoprotein [Burkholderiales bacterium]
MPITTEYRRFLLGKMALIFCVLGSLTFAGCTALNGNGATYRSAKMPKEHKLVDGSGSQIHTTDETEDFPVAKAIPLKSTSQGMMRVWIAPYEDSLNDIYAPGYLYIPLGNQSWRAQGS